MVLKGPQTVIFGCFWQPISRPKGYRGVSGVKIGEIGCAESKNTFFFLILIPSSGQKWQKTYFLFAIFQFEIHQTLSSQIPETKMCDHNT